MTLTITDAAAALRAGETTSVELVQQAIDAADRTDGQVGAFITRFVDSSLAAARRADEALAAGAEVGSLHGIPLGIKDIITTDEAPSTAQSVVHDPAWSHGDAVVVARLREAGGIVMGKTSTMEFACGLPDASKPFPVPRNPWNLDTWPGGSSSGTGSGVAAGMFLGGLGTDTGGSIRIPAAFCGITGLMPTFGRVPKSGCVPLGYTLDHIGPMARSARDCALMLQAMAGYDASDVTALDVPVPDYLAALSGNVTGLRIGVDRLVGDDDDPAISGALDAAIDVLASLGAEVIDVQLPYYTEVLAALGVIVAGEMLAYHLPDAQTRLPDFVASNRLGLGKHTFYTGADYVQAQRVRRVAHRALTALYDDVDLVLTPTAVVGALRLDDLGDDFSTWFGRIHTPYWDAMGNPVISVPMGYTAAGLPLGLQLAGRAFDEATVLRAADAYQEVTDSHLEQPPLTTAAVAA
ncbi:MAG TPA: amidase [Jatrophihabitantaceae bacterium]|jgi:aspartyl-tRNA(Asn)/glutamyl-tRNA(Gln) amidotransferase subunit A